MHNKPVSVAAWNELVASLQRCRLFAGVNVFASTDSISGEQVLSLNPAVTQAAKFNHPWRITARWSDTLKQYTFRVYPGFVNGVPARVSIPDPEDLTGEKRIQVELTQFPDIVIPDTRFVEAAQYGVPKYFQDMGVADGVPADEEEPPSTRALFRCDVVLSIPKLILNGDLTVVGEELKYSYTTGKQTVEVRENRARILTYAKWTPPSLGADVLGVGMDEPIADELVLGTIYLLGRSQEELEASPNEWENQYSIHVAHNVFWNLGYLADTQLLSYQGTTITPRANLTSALDALGEIGRLQALFATPYGVKPPSNLGHFWTV